MARRQRTNDPVDTRATGVEAPDLESGTAAPRRNFFVRLYTGTGAFEVIGKRKLWYGISGGIVLIALAAILLRGFTFGIDFVGGTKVSFRGVRDRPPRSRSRPCSPTRWVRPRSRW